MQNIVSQVPKPQNERVRAYAPQDTDTLLLKKELGELTSRPVEITPVIDGKPVFTGKLSSLICPHNVSTQLGTFHEAGATEVERAVQGALKAAPGWGQTPPAERAAIFLKAAELISEKYRYRLNAATMLGQSKTCHQAEIDSACELIDFLRFNPYFQSQLYQIQPESGPGLWNRTEYRPLEGYVFAVTPFNFTAIAGNLPASAALMGNVVLWKPASTAVYSGHFVLKILEEAGLPPGVIQFLPGSGRSVGDPALKNRNLAGVHFTGSTGVFQAMWKTVGNSISEYRSYPRIVGETGGKDFVFVHPSADTSVAVTALLRGAFEYQGQKCSAASRAYIPQSLWPTIREELVAEMKTIKVGDVSDFSCFMGAVIDLKSFENIREYIETARKSADSQVIQGGGCNAERGFFVEPTLIETTNPHARTMVEEIFGPVLTVYVYPDSEFEETLRLCDSTSPYALTGCILAQDRSAVSKATELLTQSAGNFYINNKPTGAVVGQQPFGGARGSGTNDKAGSLYNLVRWTSLRTISETFHPPTNYRYPFLG